MASDKRSEAHHDQQNKPRFTGVLRGLDPEQSILPSATPSTVESDNVPPRYSTRSARDGGHRNVIYDSKYHPMDDTLRPNSSAVRRRLGRSSSSSGYPIDSEELSEVELTSEDEVEAAVPSSSGRSQNPDQSSRTPNPNATRRSSRSQAQKLVDYNMKHHPQDHGLPFYGRQKSASVEFVEPPQGRKRTKLDIPDSEGERKQPLMQLDPDTSPQHNEGDSEMHDSDGGIGESEMAPYTARKSLRSVDTNKRASRKTARFAKRKRADSTKTSVQHMDYQDLAILIMETSDDSEPSRPSSKITNGAAIDQDELQALPSASPNPARDSVVSSPSPSQTTANDSSPRILHQPCDIHDGSCELHIDEEASTHDAGPNPKAKICDPGKPTPDFVEHVNTDFAKMVPQYIKNRLALSGKPLQETTVYDMLLREASHVDDVALVIIKPYTSNDLARLALEDSPPISAVSSTPTLTDGFPSSFQKSLVNPQASIASSCTDKSEECFLTPSPLALQEAVAEESPECSLDATNISDRLTLNDSGPACSVSDWTAVNQNLTAPSVERNKMDP